MYDHFLVFDVESIGLHGEGFAVGYVVVTKEGKQVDEGIFSCHPDKAAGSSLNRQWVGENVRPLPITHNNTKDVRNAFWLVWLKWKEKNTAMVADCAWPVEARFLATSVNDDVINREWNGPYPLHELASVLVAKGKDPLAISNRLPNELPAHDPLNDARHSARQLIEALDGTLS